MSRDGRHRPFLSRAHRRHRAQQSRISAGKFLVNGLRTCQGSLTPGRSRGSCQGGVVARVPRARCALLESAGLMPRRGRALPHPRRGGSRRSWRRRARTRLAGARCRCASPCSRRGGWGWWQPRRGNRRSNAPGATGEGAREGPRRGLVPRDALGLGAAGDLLESTDVLDARTAGGLERHADPSRIHHRPPGVAPRPRTAVVLTPVKAVMTGLCTWQQPMDLSLAHISTSSPPYENSPCGTHR